MKLKWSKLCFYQTKWCLRAYFESDMLCVEGPVPPGPFLLKISLNLLQYQTPVIRPNTNCLGSKESVERRGTHSSLCLPKRRSRFPFLLEHILKLKVCLWGVVCSDDKKGWAATENQIDGKIRFCCNPTIRSVCLGWSKIDPKRPSAGSQSGWWETGAPGEVMSVPPQHNTSRTTQGQDTTWRHSDRALMSWHSLAHYTAGGWEPSHFLQPFSSVTFPAVPLEKSLPST